MTKLRNLFAVALVMLPAVALNAGSLPSAEMRPGLNAPLPAGSCWYYIGGRWYLLPC